MEKDLLVRADADARIGGGHVMRCLALAQEFRSRGAGVLFVSRCESPALRERIESAGIELVALVQSHPHPVDLETTVSLIKKMRGSDGTCSVWTVLDGYHFDTDYQKAVRRTGCRLLIIDDCAHLPFYEADVILNQNINGAAGNYDCSRDTKLLLGTRFCLLRREFMNWRGWKRQIPSTAKKILVTLGAADPDNVTSKVIVALQSVGVPDLDSQVVVGPANPNLAELRALVNRGSANIHLLHDVKDMPALMAWADLAVTAAGSTCWEIAFMGLPAITITVAENQVHIAETLKGAGSACTLGWHESVEISTLTAKLMELIDDSQARTHMSKLGRELVDGYGAHRVFSELSLGTG